MDHVKWIPSSVDLERFYCLCTLYIYIYIYTVYMYTVYIYIFMLPVYIYIYRCTIYIYMFTAYIYIYIHTVKPLTEHLHRSTTPLCRSLYLGPNRTIKWLPKPTTSLNGLPKISPMEGRFREILLYIYINMYIIYIHLHRSGRY